MTPRPGMGVQLTLTSTEHWYLLTRYAPWSINVDLYDAVDDELANLHDCSPSLSVRLSAAHAATLHTALPDQLPLEALNTFQTRRS